MDIFPCKKTFYKDIIDKEVSFDDKWESGNGFESKHLRSKHSEIYQDDWYPKIKYVEVTANALFDTSFPIALTGRIVNVYHTSNRNDLEKSLIIIYLKDKTDVIKVKYWLNRKSVKAVHNMLSIDILCTVFVTKVHTDNFSIFDFKSVLTVPFCLVVSDDNETTHISVFKDQHKYSRIPLKIQKDGTIEGLMSLLTFINGGYQATSRPKILVSIQKIGNLKNVSIGEGFLDKIELKVFDDTCDAIFVLWGNNAKSAALWIPFDTILLLTSVSLSFHYGKAYLTFEKYSMVEINPDMNTESLRKYSVVIKHKMSNMSKLPLLKDEIKVINASFAAMFYTLAEINNLVLLKPKESIVGLVNVLITKTAKLSVLRSSNKIFVGKCCEKLINDLNYNIKCSICGEKIKMFSNSFLDFHNSSNSELDYFSEIILYSRISFMFGVEINNDISKIILIKIVDSIK
ncbi:hypothetical protein PORY_002703 [Pneumocystis oryctolagi]|uniref:Uncharacterized protein n=1 Tax=Pneumocystis oryctolagi TaxID=42067 RepID=A0ACB7C8C2_9ASCO|nr:hypothetical protein PORY_002703 [Pneumocystis oryctolagi]